MYISDRKERGATTIDRNGHTAPLLPRSNKYIQKCTDTRVNILLKAQSNIKGASLAIVLSSESAGDTDERVPLHLRLACPAAHVACLSNPYRMCVVQHNKRSSKK